MKVLLFREKEEVGEDKYHQEFERNNFTVYSIPVLSYKYINSDILCSVVSNVDNYDGLIFTSKRAVQAFQQAVDRSVLSKIKSKSIRIYAVGQATELELTRLGLYAIGSGTGNAKELSEFIIENEKCSEKALIFVCGNLAKETLPRKLTAANILHESVTCYKTIPHEKFQVNFQSYLSQNKPDIIVFFSPSGIDFYFSYIKKSLGNLKDVRIVCIGDTTATALKLLNEHVSAVAMKPTPINLVQAVKKEIINS